MRFPRLDLLKRYAHAQAGSNAVEFALLMPVFLLLVFGTIGYGIYLGAAHSLASLAAAGARVSLAGLDGAERRALSRRFIETAAGDYPIIDPARITVDTSEADSVFRITIRYDASDLPIWGPAFAHLLPSPQIVSSAATEIVLN